jgi:hypothetical protein
MTGEIINCKVSKVNRKVRKNSILRETFAPFAVKKVLFDNVRFTKLVISSGAKQSGKHYKLYISHF